MPSLYGKTIAVTEARRAGELSRLIENLGGVAYSAPAVREVPRRDVGPALAVLERIARREVRVVVFLTGVGARACLDLARRAGLHERVVAALADMLVVARGPKPVAVLREAGIRIDVVPAEPTSEGVEAALRAYDLRGQAVAVQLYGEDHVALSDALRARGAEVLEIPLYEWTLPEDVGPLERLVHDLVDGKIDVVAFTSSPQVKHLFVVAERLGVAAQLTAALRRITVAVVGPVCEAAVRERGIGAAIRPSKGTMGALVHAISGHLATEAGRGLLPDRA